MKKEVLTKEEKIRVYARCKYRGFHMLNLRNEDLKKFISECMETELREGKEKLLTKSERLKRAKKLITKYKLREQKPRKHVIIYQNVTPSKSNSVLQDFFVDPSQIQDPKEELRRFMRKHGKVPIETVLQKIKELEEE